MRPLRCSVLTGCAVAQSLSENLYARVRFVRCWLVCSCQTCGRARPATLHTRRFARRGTRASRPDDTVSHSTMVSMPGHIKFTSPFAPLQLTAADVEMLDQLSRVILRNYVAQYEEFERNG